MTSLIYDWETSLLTMAYQAAGGQHTYPAPQSADRVLLKWAYDYCERITAVNSRSFYLTLRLLPAPQRRRARRTFLR